MPERGQSERKRERSMNVPCQKMIHYYLLEAMANPSLEGLGKKVAYPPVLASGVSEEHDTEGVL